MDDAVSYLTRAATHSPDNPRFSYVLAVALHDIGKRDDAVDALKTALLRHPYDRNLLWTLASCELELDNSEESLKALTLLGQLEPDRRDIAQLIISLKNPQP